MIARILDQYPDRVPPICIVQPNRRPEHVRRWGLKAGYLLIDEQLSIGVRPYEVLIFQRDNQRGEFRDPAYDNLDEEAAMLFGPHLIRNRPEGFVQELRQEAHYLQTRSYPHPEALNRLAVIERLL